MANTHGGAAESLELLLATRPWCGRLGRASGYLSEGAIEAIRSGYLGGVIIWLNGGFGAGKTTLASELHRRLPGAVLYDPEDLGITLWKWVPRNADFQDLPSWRELVVAAAQSLRRHHADVLIVPMSLVRDAYRDEILGQLADAGERVLHVFLDANIDVLHERLRARALCAAPDPAAMGWAMDRLDPEAASRQPEGTLILRSDLLSPDELADEVLTAMAKVSGTEK